MSDNNSLQDDWNGPDCQCSLCGNEHIARPTTEGREPFLARAAVILSQTLNGDHEVQVGLAVRLVAEALMAEREATHQLYQDLVAERSFNDDIAQTVIMADEVLEISRTT